MHWLTFGKTLANMKIIAAIILSMLAGNINPETVKVEIAKYKDDKKAAVSFTYDDGSMDHYTMVAPHLEAAGIRGTFWIIGRVVGGSPYSLDWDKIKEMADRGHEMSNHTYSHKHMTKWTEEEICQDIVKCDDMLEEHLGKRPRTIALPFNELNPTILKISQEGRVGVRTRQTGQGQGRAFKGSGDRYSTLPEMKSWLQKTIDKGEWGITMTHAIVKGWDAWEDPQVYWDFIEYCGTRSDEVWFATFEDVASYNAERDACTIETSVKGSKLKVTPKCTLDSKLFDKKLTLKVSVNGKVHCIDFDPYGKAFTVNLRKLK